MCYSVELLNSKTKSMLHENKKTAKNRKMFPLVFPYLCYRFIIWLCLNPLAKSL